MNHFELLGYIFQAASQYTRRDTGFCNTHFQRSRSAEFTIAQALSANGLHIVPLNYPDTMVLKLGTTYPKAVQVKQDRKFRQCKTVLDYSHIP